MNDLSLFYRELVLAWEKFSVCKNLTGSQISTQSLWNNKFIHSKFKSLYDDSLVSKGIIYVSNLFDKKGELKNWETVSQEFNLNPVHFLKWYGVLKSIPSSWEKALRSHSVEESMISEESQCGIEANRKFIPINCVTAKLVYNLCISHKFSPPTSKKLLSTKFNIEDQKTWSSVYLLPASTTLDTKIRMFQYKILNNILYLNQRLYHMKLADSPLCSLCKREFETISRLFLRCESSKRLWAEIQKWSSHTITLPQLSEKIVYLGWFSNDPQTNLINHILLLYEYFLYSRRNDRGKVNFRAFKVYIRYVVKIEESIAKRKKNLTAHLSKWDPLMVLFS